MIAHAKVYNNLKPERMTEILDLYSRALTMIGTTLDKCSEFPIGYVPGVGVPLPASQWVGATLDPFSFQPLSLYLS